jgi:hypothetical protein
MSKSYEHNHQDTLREVALYYPGAMWTSGDWIKTIILFFDEVALLTRDETHNLSTVIDEAIAEPLLEKHMLRHLTPGLLINSEVASALLATLQDEATWKALDPIGRNEHFYYGRRVYATLNGPEPSLEMMELRNELLKHIGAGSITRDQELVPSKSIYYPTYRVGGRNPSVPIHIRLWAPLMSVIAQILRPGGFRLGLNLHPLTDQSSSVSSFEKILALPGMPSSRRIAMLHPEHVVLDLSRMPLERILHFREEHGQKYQAHRHNLLQFVVDISQVNTDTSEQIFMERWEKLAYAADELRQLARKWWQQPLPAFGLGIVGSAWNKQQSDASLLRYLARGLATQCDGTSFGSYLYFFNTNRHLPI